MKKLYNLFNLNNLNYVAVLITIIILIYVIFFSGSVGESSTLLQAILTLFFLIATIATVRRSDRQIETSQRQIKIILEQDQKHVLIADFDKNLNLQLINLSKFPMYIHSFKMYGESSDGFKGYNIHQAILAPAQFTHVIMLSNDEKSDAEVYANELASHYVLGELDKPTDKFEQIIYQITYQYGGTGSRVYMKEYKLRFDIFHPYIDAHNRMWKARMEPISFSYWTNDHSKEELALEEA